MHFHKGLMRTLATAVLIVAMAGAAMVAAAAPSSAEVGLTPGQCEQNGLTSAECVVINDCLRSGRTLTDCMSELFPGAEPIIIFHVVEEPEDHGGEHS